MLRSRFVALCLALGILPSVAQAKCEARDFLALPLPSHSGRAMVAVALEVGYPGLSVDEEAGTVTISGRSLPLGSAESRTPKERLSKASIADQFSQIYPLHFDLSVREAPWFDPGRARNDAFMRALYGSSEKTVASKLAQVTYKGATRSARFAVTTQHCAAQQLQAALTAIATEGAEMDPYFDHVGGSFNWRQIAGTRRLSAHSFGMAVDFNTKLGGYWRWSGAPEGNAGKYANRYPEALVHHMERFGFIWGGKWHHFDGMHFEYRPELILFSRLMTDAG